MPERGKSQDKPDWRKCAIRNEQLLTVAEVREAKFHTITERTPTSPKRYKLRLTANLKQKERENT